MVRAWLFGSVLSATLTISLGGCGARPPDPQTHHLTASRGPDAFAFRVRSLDSHTTLVEFELRSFQTEHVMGDGEPRTKFRLAGAEPLTENGAPAFPFLARDLAVPSAGSVSARILDTDTVVMNLGVPLVSRGEPMRQPGSAAPRSGEAPAGPAAIGVPFFMGRMRGVNLRILPFSYDSRTGLTTIVRRMHVRIHTEATPDALPVRVTALDRLARDHFANTVSVPGGFLRPTQEHTRLRIVTVETFRNSLLRFRDWKRARGIDAEIVTLDEIGGARDAKAIFRFLKDDFERNGLTHVLLVGDSEFVPSLKGTVGNVVNRVSDPSYALVSGDDSHPDIFVSRFSAKTAREVDVMVERSIRYEADLEPEAPWKRHHLGIASDEETPSDWERMRALQDVLRSAGYDRFTEVFDPGASARAAQLAIQQGVGFLTYMGHGVMDRWVTSGFSNAHIAQLTNTRWPFILSVACVVGGFSSEIGDSLAEAWLKAGTPENPYGAVGILASSTTQAWVPPAVGARRAADLLVQGRIRSLGELFMAASLGVLEHGSRDAVQTYQSWHSFGDPTLTLALPR